jgi:3-(3-hydroxy-phenyl)propionate hydroxylase
MIRLALSVGWSMTAGGEFGNLIRRLVLTRMKFVPGLRSKVIDSRTLALRRSAFVTRPRVHRQLAGTLCPNPVLADARRLDSILRDGFALITTVPPNDMQHRVLQERGAVAHIAAPDDELADWLRRAHVTSAIVRPDRAVMWAGRDMRRSCDLLPTFRPEKRIRSNV